MPSQVDAAWNEAAFAGALADPARPAPSFVAANHGGAATARFNVYRNNVAHSLVEALGQTFAAVRHLAGEERFAHVARLFIAAHPPRSPLLFDYGHGFGDFLDDFAPARQQMPWLADVARLERAWLDAWHAADRASMEAAVLGSIPAEQLDGLRLEAHPAAAVIASDWPVLALMEAGRSGMVLAVDPGAGASAVLVTRPHLAVITTSLPPAGTRFAEALLAGVSLGNAAEWALAADEAFDLAGSLATLIAAGAFAGLSLAD